MLQLPNGCRSSKPSVHPKDWNQDTASITKPWRIEYYFYDSQHNRTQWKIKGMNEYHTLIERRQATKVLYDELIRLLKEEGYNPATGQSYVLPTADIGPSTSFARALNFVFEKKSMGEDMKLDVKSMLKYFLQAARELSFADMPVGEVRRKHIMLILEHCKLSNARYNKYRSYLLNLFRSLVKWECIESNYIKEIEILDHTHRIREILSPQQCREVNDHLMVKVYTFWRFMHIFFQSAGRIKEILRVKVKDVNLETQLYKVIIRKGRKSREVLRPINGVALPLWQELLTGADDSEAFIFHQGLVPGSADKPIRREQITRRWEVHAKKDLKVTADFYALKALFLELVAQGYDINLSKDLADHQSKVVTMKHYATGEAGRDIEKKKRVNIAFPG